jgi:hypothetical protein
VLGSAAYTTITAWKASPREFLAEYNTRSHVATDSEADEIVNKAREFYDVVEAWIESKFPDLKG